MGIQYGVDPRLLLDVLTRMGIRDRGRLGPHGRLVGQVATALATGPVVVRTRRHPFKRRIRVVPIYFPSSVGSRADIVNGIGDRRRPAIIPTDSYFC